MITPEQVLLRVAGRSLSRFGTASMRRTTPQRGGEDIIETFTRASTGTYIDANGEVKLAEIDALRIDMVDLDGDGVRETPAFLLEDARTNLCLRSQELDNAAWTDLGTPIVTANDAVAPDGTTTADKIQDDDAVTNAEGRRQTFTIANDSTSWTLLVSVKKTGATAPVIGLRCNLNGGTTKDGVLVVRPDTGASLASADVVRSSVVDYGDYYRVSLTVANNTTGNVTLLFSIYAAGRDAGDIASAALVGTAIGNNHFWGAKLENAAFPSSYIATVGSTVARSVDEISFPLSFSPQATTFYLRFVEQGTTIAGGRILQIGVTGGAPNLLIQDASGVYRIEHQNGGGAFANATLAAGPAIGDIVELVGQLNADGSVQLYQSINGAAVTNTSVSSAVTPDATWGSGALLSINDNGNGTQVGFNAFVDVAVFAGIHSIADCRKALQQ